MYVQTFNVVRAYKHVCSPSHWPMAIACLRRRTAWLDDRVFRTLLDVDVLYPQGRAFQFQLLPSWHEAVQSGLELADLAQFVCDIIPTDIVLFI